MGSACSRGEQDKRSCSKILKQGMVIILFKSVIKSSFFLPQLNIDLGLHILQLKPS